MEANDKLREVLARIKNIADDYEQCVTKAGALDTIYDLACTALSVPPRNCDVGMAEEQHIRFRKFCKRFPYCSKCPVNKERKSDDIETPCAVIWSQMPYEERGSN